MIFQTIRKKVVGYWDDHTMSISLCLLILVFLIALFWHRIVISIDSGHHGVRWSRFSGTQVGKIYDEGLHIIWPWDVMYIYTTRVQTLNNSLEILTAEGLTIGVDYTVRFSVVKNAIPVIHQKLGVNYAETYMLPEVEAASMSIIGNYTPEQLYKISTLVIQASIKYYLNKRLLADNIVVDNYLIKRIILPKSVSKSIEQKIVAEQLTYEFDYRLDVERKEKERKEIEAEGIKIFEEKSGISILKWKGLEVTSGFAKSENSKIIIMGNGDGDLPLLLNTNEK